MKVPITIKPSPKLLETSIENHVNELTQGISLLDNPINNEEAKHRKNLEITRGMYIYLHDKFGAKTRGDVLNILEKRLVHPDVVGVWVEHNIINGYTPEVNALLNGYPKYKARLKITIVRKLDGPYVRNSVTNPFKGSNTIYFPEEL